MTNKLPTSPLHENLLSRDFFVERLGALTRYGAFRSSAAIDRLSLGVGHGKRISISSHALEGYINAMSAANIDDYMMALLQSKPTFLPSGVPLLKLQAALLLGVLGARDVALDSRMMALARTLSHHQVPHAGRRPADHRKASGALIGRTERLSLLRSVADTLIPLIGEPVVASAGASKRSAWHSAGYVVEDYLDVLQLPSKHSGVQRVTRFRLVKAERDGVQEFRQRFTIIWPGSGVPQTEVVAGSTARIEHLSKVTRDQIGGHQYDLVIPFVPALRAGESRSVQWSVATPIEYVPPSSRFLDRPFSLAMIPSVPVARARLIVNFPKDALPTEFHVKTNVTRSEHGRVGDSDLVTALTDRSAEASWPNEGLGLEAPEVGRACSIVWRY